MTRRWFDRSFELGLPAEARAELVERLRGTPGRLAERVGTLAVDVARRRWEGAWSIAEHAGHLADLEPLWLGRVDDLLGGEPRLRPADLDNAATWRAHHNERPVGEILGDFARRRALLLGRLGRVTAEQLRATALHPRLEQPMNLVDLCFFVAEHDDHHLATITALRSRSDRQPRELDTP